MISHHMRYFILAVFCFSIVPCKAQVIIGDCNLVVNAKNSSNVSVVVDKYTCPSEPAKALQVSYYWLGPHAASMLLNSQNYKPLRALVGEKPLVYQTETGAAMKSLIQKFGTPVERTNFANAYGITGRAQTNTEDPAEFHRRSDKYVPKLKGFRIYDALDGIFLPDQTAFDDFAKNQVPSRYGVITKNEAFSVAPEGGNIREANEVFQNIAFWRPVLRSDLLDYFGNLKSFIDSRNAGGGLFGFPYDLQVDAPPPPGVSESNEKRLAAWKAHIQQARDISRIQSVNAMLEITKNGLPSDFLFALGRISYEVHSQKSYFTHIVPPRVPVLVIAVIQNVGREGSNYALSQVSVRKSQKEDLRTLAQDTSLLELKLPIVPNLFVPGASIVFPLEIQWHLDLSERTDDWSLFSGNSEWSLANASKSEIWDVIREIPSNVSIYPKGLLSFQKRVSSIIAAGRIPKMEKAYLYGPRYEMVSATLDGKELPLRRINRNVVSISAEGFPAGSCPILYVRKNKEKTFVRVGPILVNARGADNAMLQKVDLPADTVEIEIVEEEFERTVLTHLEFLAASAKSRRSRNIAGSGPIILNMGDKLKLRVGKDRNKAALLIGGYYDLFADQLLVNR